MSPLLLWSIVSIVVFSGFASLLSWLNIEGDFNQRSGRKSIIACAFIILQLPNLQGLGYYQYWYYNCTDETHFVFCSKEWIVFSNKNKACAVVTKKKKAMIQNNLQVNVSRWRECLLTYNELYCIWLTDIYRNYM